MNKIFNTICAAFIAGSALVSCSPDDYSGPDANALPTAAHYADNFTVTVDQETNNANFNFQSAEGVTPVWIIDGSCNTDFSTKKYYRKKGDYQVVCKVQNKNGISTDSIVKTFTVEKTKMSGFAGFQEDFEHNLFKGATWDTPTFWYAPGWAQIADPSCTVANGSISLKFPEATTDQWQAQAFFPTNIALKAGTHYDFSCIFTASQDHPHATVKIGSKSNGDFVLYYNPSVKLKANEPLCVYFSDVECPADVNDLELILDFGGCAAGTDVTVENFVIKDHQYDDGTVLPKTAAADFAYDAATNLWLPIDKDQAYTMSYYYAPNWAQIADPEFKGSASGEYTFKLPAATFDRWQAQCVMNTTLSAELNTDYDFSVTIHSNNDLSTVTAKLVDGSNDGLFLGGTDAPFKVSAGADYKFQIAKAQFSGDANPQNLKIVFDFGTNPDNTEITVSEIIFQKHRE